MDSPHIPLLIRQEEEGMNLVKLKEYESNKDQEEERGEWSNKKRTSLFQ